MEAAEFVGYFMNSRWCDIRCRCQLLDGSRLCGGLSDVSWKMEGSLEDRLIVVVDFNMFGVSFKLLVLFSNFSGIFPIVSCLFLSYFCLWRNINCLKGGSLLMLRSHILKLLKVAL
uniref:Uncharacterized protein n=2 Tax=Cacopsylla melanoneura TaxID=428564 RepID=A0A8D8TA62_9HEMI